MTNLMNFFSSFSFVPCQQIVKCEQASGDSNIDCHVSNGVCTKKVQLTFMFLMFEEFVSSADEKNCDAFILICSTFKVPTLHTVFLTLIPARCNESKKRRQTKCSANAFYKLLSRIEDAKSDNGQWMSETMKVILRIFKRTTNRTKSKEKKNFKD